MGNVLATFGNSGRPKSKKYRKSNGAASREISGPEFVNTPAAPVPMPPLDELNAMFEDLLDDLSLMADKKK